MANYNRLPDDRLVAAFANGDNPAFDALLRRHQQRIFTYINGQVRNPDLADDIFQETFVKAITTIKQGRYSENGKFGAWLSRIAHNLIIDHFRQTAAENEVSVDASPESDLLNRKELCDSTVEDMIISGQVSEDIHTLVDALPDNQRDVLRMRYFGDMSFKEIAEATGVSINTALGRARYALINIRRMMTERDIVLTA